MMSCAARRRRRQSLRSPIPLHCRAMDPHSEHSLGAAPAVVRGASCETADGRVVHFCDKSLTNQSIESIYHFLNTFSTLLPHASIKDMYICTDHARWTFSAARGQPSSSSPSHTHGTASDARVAPTTLLPPPHPPLFPIPTPEKSNIIVAHSATVVGAEPSGTRRSRFDTARSCNTSTGRKKSKRQPPRP